MKTLVEGQILQAADNLRLQLDRPIVIAIDGGSGAGKTTLAAKLSTKANIALITLDDFYQTRIPEADWPHRTVEERLNCVFDWGGVRQAALEPLRAGEPGQWQPFDFAKGLNSSGTYDLKTEVTRVCPAPFVIIEGTYSASPHLRDIIDLAVLVCVPTDDRHHRIEHREQNDRFVNDCHKIWDEVETMYFEITCPPSSFDIVVQN